MDQHEASGSMPVFGEPSQISNLALFLFSITNILPLFPRRNAVHERETQTKQPPRRLSGQKWKFRHDNIQ